MLRSGNARIRRNDEKNDLIYLKDNNSDEFFQEIRGLTEITILCELLTTNTLRVLESRAS